MPPLAEHGCGAARKLRQDVSFERKGGKKASFERKVLSSYLILNSLSDLPRFRNIKFPIHIYRVFIRHT